jgi:hypothetical protein
MPPGPELWALVRPGSIAYRRPSCVICKDMTGRKSDCPGWPGLVPVRDELARFAPAAEKFLIRWVTNAAGVARARQLWHRQHGAGGRPGAPHRDRRHLAVVAAQQLPGRFARRPGATGVCQVMRVLHQIKLALVRARYTCPWLSPDGAVSGDQPWRQGQEPSAVVHPR